MRLILALFMTFLLFGCSQRLTLGNPNSSSLDSTSSATSNFGAVSLAMSPAEGVIEMGVGDNLNVSLVVTTANVVESAIWQKAAANGSYQTVPGTTTSVDLSASQTTDTLTLNNIQTSSAGVYRASVLVQSLDGKTSQYFYSNTVQITVGGIAGPTPAPTAAPTATPAMASASGTTVPPATQIIDTQGNIWTVSSGVVLEGGKAAGYSANVTLLLYYKGVIYQQTKVGWWSWTNNTWLATTDPRVSATPTATPAAPTPTPTPAPTPPTTTMSGAPSAVTDLVLALQGGPGNLDGNASNSLSNYQAISWQPATAGAHPISYYQIYRNGMAYARQATPTVFQGYISGTVLTVTSVTSGTVLPQVRYGAPGLATGTFIDAVQSSGTKGGAGTYRVNVSQNLGSNSSPVTFSAWQFIDSNAPGSNDPTLLLPATAYSYQVAAVDTSGNAGPLAANYSAYAYQNGFSNWGYGSTTGYELSYGASSDYTSTAGNPVGSPYDLSVNFSGGGWQPASQATQVPVNDLEVGGFNYMVLDMNPGANVDFTMRLGILTRTIQGDTPLWKGVNLFDYGPAPVANKWATYKVPLSALSFGVCNFSGYISGATLHVLSTTCASSVDGSGHITGPGVPVGTYTSGYNQQAAIGTFPLAGPGISSATTVGSSSNPVNLTYQRTTIYKFNPNPSHGVTAYFNNIGWTLY